MSGRDENTTPSSRGWGDDRPPSLNVNIGDDSRGGDGGGVCVSRLACGVLLAVKQVHFLPKLVENGQIRFDR